METIETIVKWNKETFPDTNLEEQLQKFINESKEFEEADDEFSKLKELADCYIVSFGLLRFNNLESLGFVYSALCSIFNKVKQANLLYNSDVFEMLLWKEINSKMAINRKRKWHKVNGEYRHI